VNKKQITYMIISAVFVVLFIGAVFLYGRLTENYTPDVEEHNGQESEQNTAEPVEAPDFTVYDADGNEVRLSDFKGKPVIVNFWATWCGPCKSEIPSFEKAIAEYGDKIEFLMINVTDGVQDTVEGVKKFMDDNGYEFRVLYDLNLEAAQKYGASSIPLTYFIDSEGYAVNGYLGAIPEKTLNTYITLLLEGDAE